MLARVSDRSIAGQLVLRQGRDPAAVDQRFQNPCDGMRSVRSKREDAFSYATIIVGSVMVSSSQCYAMRANSPSSTSRRVSVIASAYSSAIFPRR
jgi:hypothetical protein